jgi:glycosyltransferase involved in cell wall biosynthesis
VEPLSFSVIIPLYNYERFVTDAVRSVQAQTYPHWEVIICDDGSIDRGGALADELAATDPRVRVVHQRNAGLPAARNTAIQHARHPWLALLDADDQFFPDTLAHHAATIAANPGYLLTHGYYHRLEPDGSTTVLTGSYQDRPTGPREYFDRVYLNPSCVCFHRGLVDRHGPFDERLKVSEDYDFFLRAGRETSYVPVNKPVCLRRRHGSNLSSQSGWTRTVEAWVLERFVTAYGGDRFVSPDQLRRRLARLYYSAGRHYLRAGYNSQAIVAFGKSIALQSSAKARAFKLAGQVKRLAGSKYDYRPFPSMEPMPEAMRFLMSARS